VKAFESHENKRSKPLAMNIVKTSELDVIINGIHTTIEMKIVYYFRVLNHAYS